MLPENYQSSSMNLVKLQVTKLTHRNLLHFYTLTMIDQKEEFKIVHLLLFGFLMVVSRYLSIYNKLTITFHHFNI